MKIGSVYWYHLARLTELSSLQPVLTSLETVLADIDGEMQSRSKELEDAVGDARWAIDSHIQDLAEFYHEMLGIAFIAAQVEIARAVAIVRKVRDLSKRKGVQLLATSGDKVEIMRHGFANLAQPSPIEIINAAANFQKHSDEWPRRWDEYPPQNANALKTIGVIRALGLKSDDFVVDECARILGIEKPTELSRLQDEIASWRLGIARAYEAELAKQGVHPPDDAP